MRPHIDTMLTVRALENTRYYRVSWISPKGCIENRHIPRVSGNYISVPKCNLFLYQGELYGVVRDWYGYGPAIYRVWHFGDSATCINDVDNCFTCIDTHIGTMYHVENNIVHALGCRMLIRIVMDGANTRVNDLSDEVVSSNMIMNSVPSALPDIKLVFGTDQCLMRHFAYDIVNIPDVLFGYFKAVHHYVTNVSMWGNKIMCISTSGHIYQWCTANKVEEWRITNNASKVMYLSESVIQLVHDDTIYVINLTDGSEYVLHI